MYPAMVAMLLYVAFTLAVAARAAPGRRLVAQLGLIMSATAAITIIGNYFLQLADVQPSLLAGEADGISLLTQCNEHGTFIALEELGYRHPPIRSSRPASTRGPLPTPRTAPA